MGMGKAAYKAALEAVADWKICSPYHWQAIVDGAVLDYWPSKKKWRHEDSTRTGDILAYIRGREGDFVHAAKIFVELDADEQAEFYRAVLAAAENWSEHGSTQFEAIGKSIPENIRPRFVLMLRAMAQGAKGKE